MFSDVLAVHDKSTVCTGAGAPVPVKVSAVVEGCALLVKVSVPLAAPVVEGLKFTVNPALWPAGMVTGSDKPLTLNTALFELTDVTVTAAPLAVRLPDPCPVVPTTTLPRARVVGLTVSWPAAAVPVPDNGIFNVGFDAFEVTATLPLAAPADVGANTTVKLVLWPVVSVTGTLVPLRLNPDPLTAI